MLLFIGRWSSLKNGIIAPSNVAILPFGIPAGRSSKPGGWCFYLNHYKFTPSLFDIRPVMKGISFQSGQNAKCLVNLLSGFVI